MSERIVIVGGGFAGFWAAVAARRVGGSAVRVSLVSREPSLVIRPRLYESDPQQSSVGLLALLEMVDVEFVDGAAVDLDVDDQRLALGSGATVEYDRLVVAVGSVMSRPAVPGADEVDSIDTQNEAVAFDRRLCEIAAAKRPSTIAVVGAGFTGIELALELRDRVDVHGGDGELLRIVLIDRARVVGSELGLGPRSTIEAALDSARVERRLGATVTSLAPDRVSFADDDDVLAVDAVVLCTGLVAAPFAARVPGRRDWAGRIVVGPDLRAPEAPYVFVAGDAAAADTGDGNITLQSCQHALQLGRFAGENAARDLLGLPLARYEQLRYVTCLDLGRAGAVLTSGWDREVVVVGEDAKAIKRKINTEVIYPRAGATVDELLADSALPVDVRYAAESTTST